MSDLERAVGYYEKNINAADLQRQRTTDAAVIAEIDRQQDIRRTSLSRLQAELNRARADAYRPQGVGEVQS